MVITLVALNTPSRPADTNLYEAVRPILPLVASTILLENSPVIALVLLSLSAMSPKALPGAPDTLSSANCFCCSLDSSAVVFIILPLFFKRVPFDATIPPIASACFLNISARCTVKYASEVFHSAITLF